MIVMLEESVAKTPNRNPESSVEIFAMAVVVYSFVFSKASGGILLIFPEQTPFGR